MLAINLAEKFARIHDHWAPKNVAQLNDLHIKAVKVQGEFVWHAHEHTDELFWVVSGELVIRVEDGSGIREVSLRPGEILVVPKGVRHQPTAAGECEVVLIEPAGTVNTGDAGGRHTAPADAWI